MLGERFEPLDSRKTELGGCFESLESQTQRSPTLQGVGRGAGWSIAEGELHKVGAGAQRRCQRRRPRGGAWTRVGAAEEGHALARREVEQIGDAGDRRNPGRDEID